MWRKQREEKSHPHRKKLCLVFTLKQPNIKTCIAPKISTLKMQTLTSQREKQKKKLFINNAPYNSQFPHSTHPSLQNSNTYTNTSSGIGPAGRHQRDEPTYFYWGGNLFFYSRGIQNVCRSGWGTVGRQKKQQKNQHTRIPLLFKWQRSFAVTSSGH